jgi:hypothetical protein
MFVQCEMSSSFEPVDVADVQALGGGGGAGQQQEAVGATQWHDRQQ